MTKHPPILFAVTTLAPLPLLVAGAFSGAPWVWLALAYMAGLTALIDHLAQKALPETPEEGDFPTEFPAATALSVTLALAQLALIPLVIHALSGTRLSGWEKFALFLAAGQYLGQVGNSNAHELIHRGSRFLRGLGIWAYISVLFGHHASAHVLVHHVRVATPDDPNSARRGEGLYRFLLRAWRGSFQEGLRQENARMRRAGRPLWRHPYALYIGGAALMLLMAALLGGWRGVLWYLALAGYAQMQLLMSDYVQHYGLRRARRADGRYEPVSLHHSWNSGHPASSALMLNAPRHSDHHAAPLRPYPALRLPEGAPMLPRSLPVMAVIALFPSLWRRVMDRRVERWQDRPERSGDA